MRIVIASLSVCVFCTSFSAAEQLFVVAPDSLDAWSVSGTDKSELQSATTLTLPAGAQLDREFPASAVVLRLTGRPLFSEKPDEWPILSVGPAAVAFIQKDGGNHMTLVVGESTVEDLPWTVAPGDAVQDLLLGYDAVSGTGLLVFRGQAHPFSTHSSTKSVSVWVGAGSSAPWPVELMQVLALTPDDSPPGSDHVTATDLSPKRAAERFAAALNRLQNAGHSGEAGATSDAGSVAAKGGILVPRATPLEVFTPPSVRRSKIVATVKAALATQTNK